MRLKRHQKKVNSHFYTTAARIMRNCFFLFLDLAWKPAQIRCLIELHRIKKSDFENPRLTKKYVWLEIALEIQNRFPDFAPTRDQVELKYFTRTMHIVCFLFL